MPYKSRHLDVFAWRADMAWVNAMRLKNFVFFGTRKLALITHERNNFAAAGRV
jgi:hypothetical protein